MKDRIYQHENRFLMKDIDGMNPKEITLERVKGTVTQEGTPLNKATLLSDEAANMLGLPSLDPTPSDAFLKIAEIFGQLEKRTTLYSNSPGKDVGGTWNLELSEYEYIEIDSVVNERKMQTCKVKIGEEMRMGFNYITTSNLYSTSIAMSYTGGVLKYVRAMSIQWVGSTPTVYTSVSPLIVKITGIK